MKFQQRNGKLKLCKPQPWFNCLGIVDNQPNDKGILKPVRKCIIVYVWDTKKIVHKIDVPNDWYLVNPENEEDMQDFESIFVTKLVIPSLIVPDPIPGPMIKSF